MGREKEEKKDIDEKLGTGVEEVKEPAGQKIQEEE